MTSDPARLHLEIVPCVDSLLYAPVYIALIGLLTKYNVQPNPQNPSVFTFPINGNNGPVLDLTLAPPPVGGDVAVLHRLEARDNTFRIGICDPITVIQANAATWGTAKEKEWRPPFRILAVFIDRIALSLVTRKDRSIPSITPDEKEDNKAYQDYKRAEALHRVIEQLTSDSLNDVGLLKTMEGAERIIYDFWSSGETTEYLTERFLEIPSRKQNGRDGREFERLLRLVRGKSDVAITHSPWSIKFEEDAEQLDFFTRECFPSIQFPFSAIVIPDKGDLKEYGPTVQQFISALSEGLILLTRHPGLARDLLTARAKSFRYYGLRVPDQVQYLASCALNHFLKIGCFADKLMPEWTAWEYALGLAHTWWQAKADEAAKGGKPMLWDRFAWKIVNGSLDNQFIEELPSAEDYLGGMHLKFVRAAKKVPASVQKAPASAI